MADTNALVTLDERATMVARYRDSASISSIAAALRRSRRTVIDHLQEAGCIARTRPQGVSETLLEILVEAYVKDGTSIRQLGQAYDLSGTMVRRALLFAGVTLRPRGFPMPTTPPDAARPKDREQVLEAGQQLVPASSERAGDRLHKAHPAARGNA